MADPTKYTTDYDFSGFQSTNPSSPLPGTSVDNEFANIETSIDEIVDAITDIRRSDGALANGIVTREALADEVADLAGASAYQVAVDNGFVGTEAEWLTSLEGDAATISVGNVTTLDAGSSATVTNVGTASAAIFDIAIPRGDPGATGAGTGDMLAATYDPYNVIGDVFNMQNMVEAADAKILTAAERTKLAGIATAATANSADATLLARANHTGTQLAATISDFTAAADARVAAAIGVSVQAQSAILAATTASFTTADETKLDGVAAGATANDTDQVLKREHIVIACSDGTTAISSGTAKAKFRMPHAMTLLAGSAGVRASLTTAQVSGSIFTVDINESGSTILSTKLTIDNTEKTSTTAATAVVISDTTLADDAEISIDVDQIGTSGATGLKVTLIGYRP